MATTYKRNANKANQHKAREMTQDYTTMPSADINTLAIQLQASLNAVSEQLALFNALLMRINHVKPVSIQMENRAWLSLSESSFTFWDNKEDAVYDTL